MSCYKVSVNKDDTLTVSVGERAGRYAEIAPFEFREIDGPRRLVFKEGETGQVLYLFPADVPPVSAIRRAWYERTGAQWGLVGGSVAVFASALLFWPAIGFSLRGMKSSRIKRTGFSWLLSLLAWMLSAIAIGLAAAMAYSLKEPTEIVFGLTKETKLVLALPQVCAVLAGLTVLACLIAWMRGYWRLTGRLHYTLVALAGVGFVWFLYHWNLLSFGLPALGS
jgi:hypothetical protein